MAFFDKLETFAKNIGDKTSDAIETGKLNSKINAEKNLAAEQWKKIGEYYYNLYIYSGEAIPEILEFCESAKAHLAAAEEARIAIEKIKEENEAQAKAQAAAAAATATAAVPTVPQSSGTLTCTACGAEIPEGRKFCSECGAKVVIPEPTPAPAANVCQNCGAEIAEGKKFCSECGTKIEIPEPTGPKCCVNCGAEIAEGRKFCSECGTKQPE